MFEFFSWIIKNDKLLKFSMMFQDQNYFEKYSVKLAYLVIFIKKKILKILSANTAIKNVFISWLFISHFHNNLC